VELGRDICEALDLDTIEERAVACFVAETICYMRERAKVGA